MTTRLELLQDLDAWLARDDVATDADAPTILRMAEAEINRRLRTRAQEVVSTLVCSGRSTPVPTGFLTFRFATLESALGRDVEYLTPERIREAPIWNNQGGGLTDNTATAMTIEGDSDATGAGGLVVTLAPAPTALAPVTLNIGYFRTFPALTGDTDTNWLLTNNYDIYLFACLMQVGVWDDDERIEQKYEYRMDRAIAQLDKQENRARIPTAKGLIPTGNPRRVV